MGEKKKIIGIENNKSLIAICKKNFKKMGVKYPTLISQDARKVSIQKINDYKIFYLYNPFSAKIIRDFFKKNSFRYSAIIYFNPLHSDELVNLNYKCVCSKKTYRNGSSYNIFITKGLEKSFKNL